MEHNPIHAVRAAIEQICNVGGKIVRQAQAPQNIRLLKRREGLFAAGEPLFASAVWERACFADILPALHKLA